MVSVNLEFGERRLRVACGSPRAARILQSALSDHVLPRTEDSPLGFLIQPPRGRNRMYRLADRAGVVLGSSRTLKPILAMLASHLTAWLPPPEGWEQFRVRAIASPRGAALCFPPLMFVPPPNPREFARTQWDIIDRLAVDIDGSGQLRVPPIPWPKLAALSPPPGHRRPIGETVPVLTLVFGTHRGGSSPVRKPTALVELAATAISGSPWTAISTADRLVSCAELLGIAPTDVNRLPGLVDRSPRT